MTNLRFLVFFLSLSISNAWASIYTIGPCVLAISEPCNTSYVTFTMFSPSNSPATIDPYHPNIPLKVDLTKPLKVIIDGYGGNVVKSAPNIIQAYRKKANVNVLFVDWGKLSDTPCYPGAIFNMWQAAQCTSTLLTSLSSFGVNAKQIHIVGFSLGAHVAGATGDIYEKFFGAKLGRITGLDPALPLFATAGYLRPNYVLNANQAKFVDIIHTSSGNYGKIEPTGHLDFYVHDGSNQPFCRDNPNKLICSHLLAPVYFAESILTKVGFWGTYCHSYSAFFKNKCNDITAVVKQRNVLMGEHAIYQNKGIYFVQVNTNPPFALGPNQTMTIL